ncbi:39S ribosomal protein L28, mitochondrial-like isoform X1 [Acipenser oxyrinchus oxyrinchus]|uniref:Large ribosomal subunit protein bL28m n=1 Tax=Acipenser oxyrinchus oxyrinchus TaxID=40147 RepID=A0AAD8FWL8_ACIOX|nr:39S ribosomal protein L28, mitochondrial-like isoform X1 [Acipenser oxyrinchus oxyrinchus]
MIPCVVMHDDLMLQFVVGVPAFLADASPQVPSAGLGSSDDEAGDLHPTARALPALPAGESPACRSALETPGGQLPREPQNRASRAGAGRSHPCLLPPRVSDRHVGWRGLDCGIQLSNRLKKVWKPQLFNRELYSEILDHKFKITVTARTLDLVDAAYGLDFYILRTPQEDLNSKLGMDLKRAMLLRLARKDTELYPENPAKRETVFNKYKEFVMPVEEAEWVGLSLEEAVEKQRLLEKKDPEPLFKGFVEDLVQELATRKLSEPEIVEKKS